MDAPVTSPSPTPTFEPKPKEREVASTSTTKAKPDRKKILIRVAAGIALLLVAYFLYAWVKSLNPLLTAYGNVDIRDVNLGFRVFGRISEVLKDEGDKVHAGDLVARLDRTPLQHALDQAVADVTIKQAVYDEAQKVFVRDQNLVKNGAISLENFQDTTSNRDQAAANLLLSQAKVASTKTDLDDTQLLAPSDGVIITRAQEPGAIVQAGTTVLTLLLEHPVWIRAYLDESDLGQVFPGKEVDVSTDSDPGKWFHGVVGYVSPEAEFTPKAVETTQLRTSLVYRIRVVVNDADPTLRQGMPVTIRIRKK